MPSTTTSTPAASSTTSLTVLGGLAVLGAPGLLVEQIIRHAFSLGSSQSSNGTNVAGLVYLIGWAAAMIGWRRLRATGNGMAALVVFAVQMVGLSLAAGQQLIDLTHPAKLVGSAFYGICDVAWPLSHLLMLVVGGMTLAAKRIRGPLRFAPLACGLVLPVAFALGSISHSEAMQWSFGVITTACFAAQGIAVMREARAAQR